MNCQEFDKILEGLPRRLTPEQVAELLCLTPRTLRLWRAKGVGPTHIRIGKKIIRYDEPVVMAWLEHQKCLSSTGCCPTCGARVLLGGNTQGARP